MHWFILLDCGATLMWSSFLVGEGARIWAKSKGIVLPATIAQAEEVLSFFLLSLSLSLCLVSPLLSFLLVNAPTFFEIKIFSSLDYSDQYHPFQF